MAAAAAEAGAGEPSRLAQAPAPSRQAPEPPRQAPEPLRQAPEPPRQAPEPSRPPQPPEPPRPAQALERGRPSLSKPGSRRRPAGRAGRAWLWSTVALTVGAMAGTALLAPPGSAGPDRALSWLLFTGSSVHVAATGWVFTVPEVRAHARRHARRYLWAPLGLVALASVLAALIPPAPLRWMLLPYFGWQFFHFQKQNLGMSALAAATGRAPALSTAERRALLASGWAGIGGLLAHPALLGTGLGDVGGATPGGRIAGVAFAVAGAAFACSVAAGLSAHARRPAGARPGGLTVTYLSALLFSLPVFLFSSPYAAVGGMTVAHGFQYLLLIALIAGGRPGGASTRLFALGLLANVALIGGALLAAASHLHSAGPAGRAVFGIYLGVVMAHFVVDAGLWRLRDPFPRQFLTAHVPYLVQARAGRAAASHSPADRSVSDIGWVS